MLLPLLSSLALAAPPLSAIKLPPGFKIELYASGIENARSMALGPKGTLFIGTRSGGKVYALKDGKLVYMVERRDIEARSAEAIADLLTLAFDKYCAPATAAAH